MDSGWRGLVGVGVVCSRKIWLGVGLAGWLGMAAWVAVRVPPAPVHAAAQAGLPLALPDEACAGCHREIYERYRKTPMANASGAAVDGFLAGSFTHEASGVHYKMVREGGRVYLDFARTAPVGGAPGGAGAGAGDAMAGRRELRYFLGSGKRGRTYLFEQEGYWFESPINWYAKKKVWDMAPGYLEAREMPLTLPVDPGCLRCHASGAQASLAAARNKYAGTPFTEGGITCTACHDGRGEDGRAGDGRAGEMGSASAAEHVASGGKVLMAKIDQLEPVKRDSICLTCHLEGEAAVVHPGKRLVDFRPGESVFAYASYFVGEKQASGGERATSQWEALLKSGCKRGSGAKLTCTSCHDPHGSTAGMSAGERVEFYRGRCLACHDGGEKQILRSAQDDKHLLSGESKAAAESLPSHTGREDAAARMGRPVPKPFSDTHHAENRDCAACHMPRAASSDIAHEQVTDHQIPRVPRDAGRAAAASADRSEAETLVRVEDGDREPDGGDRDLDRDLGLAYAMAGAKLAGKGSRAAGERAVALLKRAEGLPGSETDHELHAQLGFLEQLGGNVADAEREYDLALKADAEDSFAMGNLALLKAGQREYGAAAGLWAKAFEGDPVQLKAGMNLALVECGLGRREAALGTLDRILAFSPDDGAARELARGIRSGAHGCSKR